MVYVCHPRRAASWEVATEGETALAGEIDGRIYDLPAIDDLLSESPYQGEPLAEYLAPCRIDLSLINPRRNHHESARNLYQFHP